MKEKSRICKDGRRRIWIKLKCSVCKRKFWKQKRELGRYPKTFCSLKCFSKYRRKRFKRVCANCGKIVYRIKAHAKNKTNTFFCNNLCKCKAISNKNIFQRTKKINCYKCGKKILVDYRASRKLCNDCKPKIKPKTNYDEILKNGDSVPSFCTLRRYIIKNGIKKNRCEICGRSKWMGKPLTMQLHHVDGNRANNKLKNLKMLCPNCHSQTKNWGTKKWCR